MSLFPATPDTPAADPVEVLVLSLDTGRREYTIAHVTRRAGGVARVQAGRDVHLWTDEELERRQREAREARIWDRRLAARREG